MKEIQLPRGTGSIQLRGRKLYLIYRDEAGRSIQENSGTDDYNAAQTMLIERALIAARARVATLEMAHEAAEAAAAGHADQAPAGNRNRGGRRSRGGSVPKDHAGVGQNPRPKKSSGGTR